MSPKVDSVQVPISSAMRDVRVKVTMTGLAMFRFRLWLGAELIRIGARVAGCRCDIAIGGDEPGA